MQEQATQETEAPATEAPTTEVPPIEVQYTGPLSQHFPHARADEVLSSMRTALESEAYAPIWRLESRPYVGLYGLQGQYVPPGQLRSSDNLRIVLFSSPLPPNIAASGELDHAPRRQTNITEAARWLFPSGLLEPSGIGIPIKRHHATAAEVFDKTIYLLYFPLGRYVSQEQAATEGELLHDILIEAAEYLKLPADFWERHSEHWREKVAARKVARLEHALIKQRQYQIRRLRADIQSHERELTRLQRASHDVSGALWTAKNRYQRYEAEGDRFARKTARENIHQIINHNLVEEVYSVLDDEVSYLAIETTELTMLNPATELTYELGCMKIMLPLADETGTHPPIRIANLTRQGATFHGTEGPHPHIGSDGVPCWGDVGPEFQDLLVRGEYEMLVHGIIEWLQVVNPSDTAGRLVWFWPLTEDSESGELVLTITDETTGEELPLQVRGHIRYRGRDNESRGDLYVQRFTEPDVQLQRLPVGFYCYDVEAVGYLEDSGEFAIDDGDTTTVRVELEPDLVQLWVQSTAPGARFNVRRQGSPEPIATDVPINEPASVQRGYTYAVEVQAEGFMPRQYFIDIFDEDEPNRYVHARLAPEGSEPEEPEEPEEAEEVEEEMGLATVILGSFTTDSVLFDIRDAETNDYVHYDLTQGQVELPEGTYEIEARADGYHRAVNDLYVEREDCMPGADPIMVTMHLDIDEDVSYLNEESDVEDEREVDE